MIFKLNQGKLMRRMIRFLKSVFFFSRYSLLRQLGAALLAFPSLVLTSAPLGCFRKTLEDRRVDVNLAFSPPSSVRPHVI